MNLPNKLTLLRIILIPFMVVVNYIPYLNEIIYFDFLTLANIIMLLIFLVASFTDFLDGYIARKYNLVTTFGKFMDPLADKILTSAAYIIFIEQGLMPGWILTVILAREFMVSGVRLASVDGGVVIAASNLGKYKTVSQILSIIFMFIGGPVLVVGEVLLYIALALTIISGYDYLKKNISAVLKTK